MGGSAQFAMIARGISTALATKPHWRKSRRDLRARKCSTMESNLINLDDLRGHEGTSCVCINCQAQVVSVALKDAIWPRECPKCECMTLHRYVDENPPNYRQVGKCCYTCHYCLNDRCRIYKRLITSNFICDDWKEDEDVPDGTGLVRL